jgi:phosphoglycerol transferase MdoB-like AlkP superfamily enzyme
MKDYAAEEQKTAKWGVRDDITFETLYQQIVQSNSGEHYLWGYSTLSSHEPWDVPTHRLKDPILNAFNYLDQCIGRFIDALRKTPAWQNTLVVILPDHGYRYKGIDEATRLYNHIPMLWVGGAVRQPVVIDRLCNQSDLAATLLGQMGINHDDFRFSRDILSSSYRQPMAYHTSTSCVSVYDSTGWMAYDLDANSMITSEGDDTERLLRLSRALLQLTSYDLKEK